MTTKETSSMDIDALQPGFTYLVLQKLDPATNARRFYYLAWQPTILGWAVVRAHGRIGERCRMLAPLPFASRADAWPLIRKTIRIRLRHGYQIVADFPRVAPEICVTLDGEASTSAQTDSERATSISEESALCSS